MDKSGLSDPFAVINISSFRKSSEKILKTVNPKWDEMLIFDKVTIYGKNLQKNPPTVTVEIYDYDKFGDSDYMGEVTLVPNIILQGSPYNPSKLEWYNLKYSGESAGDLLASFDLIEICSDRQLAIAKPGDYYCYFYPFLRFFCNRVHLELLLDSYEQLCAFFAQF